MSDVGGWVSAGDICMCRNVFVFEYLRVSDGWEFTFMDVFF